MREFSRVLKPESLCLVQLSNAFGTSSIVRQARRGFRDAPPNSFEMRHSMRAGIRAAIEKAGLRRFRPHADGVFWQGSQLSDLDLLSPLGKLIVVVSHVGRKAADALPFIVRLADSIWVNAHSPQVVSRTVDAKDARVRRSLRFRSASCLLTVEDSCAPQLEQHQVQWRGPRGRRK